MNSSQVCTRCIMDTSAQNIKFDSDGHCNFCNRFLSQKNKKNIIAKDAQAYRLKSLCENIKKTKGKKYDCVIGVSGGVDSTYALHLLKELGINPLAVHLDNGWNSEMATSNIFGPIKALGIDLHTHVIDWELYKDLQRSFIAADVIDIELLTDHAIIACLHQIANKHGVSYILTGMNNSTEGMNMPSNWNHFKLDEKNIRIIHKMFGKIKGLKSYPHMSLFKYCYYRYVKKITVVDFLDYFDYNKDLAAELLIKKYNFKPFENKHYENIFTRFHQAYILPRKFKVDKRRLHLSNLICSGQITRAEALKEMSKGSYPTERLEQDDFDYVIKKLNYSAKEFSDYINRPSKKHRDYPSDYGLYRKLRRIAYKY